MKNMEPPLLRDGRDDRKQPQYQVKSNGEVKYTILPGEDPLEFESLHQQLAEDLLPIGPLEEDDVLTIAKGIWRKWRYQRFMSLRAAARRTDPTHDGYCRVTALYAFFIGLDDTTGDEDISKAIDCLESEFADHLKEKCARDQFRHTKAWVDAIKKETVFALAMAARCPIGQEGSMLISSRIFTDEERSDELEFEARIDREIERARERIWRSQARRQVSLREVTRVDRSNSVRLSDIVK